MREGGGTCGNSSYTAMNNENVMSQIGKVFEGTRHLPMIPYFSLYNFVIYVVLPFS